MIFGGFAQFIVTWLIHTTGMAIAPVFYVMFAVTLGLIAGFFLIDRTHDINLDVVDDEGPDNPALQAETRPAVRLFRGCRPIPQQWRLDR